MHVHKELFYYEFIFWRNEESLFSIRHHIWNNVMIKFRMLQRKFFYRGWHSSSERSATRFMRSDLSVYISSFTIMQQAQLTARYRWPKPSCQVCPPKGLHLSFWFLSLICPASSLAEVQNNGKDLAKSQWVWRKRRKETWG